MLIENQNQNLNLEKLEILHFIPVFLFIYIELESVDDSRWVANVDRQERTQWDSLLGLYVNKCIFKVRELYIVMYI